MLDAAARRRPLDASAILGRIDVVQGNRIHGWAWDRRHPDARLEVEVFVGDQTVATVIADRARPDLSNSGIGDGQHAFDVRLPHAIRPEARSTIRAFARGPAGDGRALPCPTPTEQAAESLIAPHLVRVVQLLESLHTANRTGQASQQEALNRLLDLIADGCETSDRSLLKAVAEISANQQELREQQLELREQVNGLEVFAIRLDESLRALVARLDAAPDEKRRAERTLAGVIATAGVVLGGLIGLICAGIP